MNDVSIAVIGGDLRQYYLANYLIQNGYDVICYGNTNFEKLPEENNTDNLDKALIQNVIIGSVPFTKDNQYLNSSVEIPLTFCTKLREKQVLIGGNIPPFVQKICSEKGLTYYDYMKSDALVYQNAEITAEGTVCEIIQNTQFVLQNANVLLIGYGKCGTMIAHKLNALGCNISIYDKDEKRRIIAEALGFNTYSTENFEENLLKYQVIVNTAPEMVMTENNISRLYKECVLFDIASAPGGIDWKFSEKAGIAAFQCLGLPAKAAPKTAGEVIAKDVLNYIQHNILRKD